MPPPHQQISHLFSLIELKKSQPRDGDERHIVFPSLSRPGAFLFVNTPIFWVGRGTVVLERVVAGGHRSLPLHLFMHPSILRLSTYMYSVCMFLYHSPYKNICVCICICMHYSCIIHSFIHYSCLYIYILHPNKLLFVGMLSKFLSMSMNKFQNKRTTLLHYAVDEV